MSTDRPDDAFEQYFTGQPSTASAPIEIIVHLDGLEFPLLTDTGVFSRGRLDRGTAVLLRQAPPPASSGHLLDLGCGAGPVAVALAMRSPEATVWACDVNERALELCRRNVARLGLDNVNVAHPDDIDPEVRFTQLWSNPPIRIGKQQLQMLLTRWLERLDGDAWLVVQRHLGADSLQRWLAGIGCPTVRWASQAGYRLLHVERCAIRR